MSDSAPIPVVCALIERDGKVLIAQRPAHKHLPFKWEFPGGKVEKDETPADAIVREIREELGIEVVVTRTLPSFNHAYGAVVIEMIPFVCRQADVATEAHAHEHIALAWVSPADLKQHNLAAADLPVVDNYLKM